MVNTMNETINWDIKEYEILEETAKQVKVRINALRPIKSRNGRVYTFSEMLESGRTLSHKPINVNHNDGRVVGNTDWAKANKSTQILEVTGVVNKEPYVYMLKNHDSKIKGWSVQADFLHAKCTKCPEAFDDMTGLKDHLIKEHQIHNIEYEPQDIMFNALALVIDPEVPGIPGTSHEIYETVGSRHFGSLQEMVDTLESEDANSWLLNKFTSKQEKIDMTETKKDDVPYIVKQPLKTQETVKEPIVEQVLPPTPTPPIKESSTIQESTKLVEKVTLKEQKGRTFEQCMADGGSEEECALECKETRIANENFKSIEARLNAIIEYVNTPLPKDDVSWSSRIDNLQHTIENRLTTFASEMVDATNNWNREVAKLTEALNSIPKDEWKQPLTEAIAAIKPYDDAPLKEMIAKIPIYNDAPLKEALAVQRKEFETVLAVADKNIVETRRSLEEQLKAKDLEIKASLKETADNKIVETQKLEVRVDNLEDKIKPVYKGKAKDTVKQDQGQINTFTPYTN